ncbi:MAG: hypothetical protein ACLP8S_20580 [Solirubrobacteraceae bacterium]
MSTSTSDTTTASQAPSNRPAAGAPKTASASKATGTSKASASATSTQPASSVRHVQQIAERAILVPVGAGLVVRDNIVSTVKGLATKYTTRGGIERELKRYERRGVTARTRLERQVRRRRNRFERELRQRRRKVERAVAQNRKRVEREVLSVRKDVSKRSDLVTGPLEKLVANAQDLIGSIS